jgi:hypothetical protein
MQPRTLGRVIAAVIIIVALYFAVQYSKLSESDVDKVRDKVAADKQEQVTDASESDQDSPVSSSDAESQNPAISAFEEFVAELPSVSFISEIDRYFAPGAEVEFRTQMASMSSDPLQAAKGLFSLHDLIYAGVQKETETEVQFEFNASNDMSRIMGSGETSSDTIWQYHVNMELHYGTWLIRQVTMGPMKPEEEQQ